VDQVNIGRRHAIERTAHFFMELAERLSVMGFGTETEFKCPLSQFVLADALGGLSATAFCVSCVRRTCSRSERAPSGSTI
jgi:hypothetical protein